MPCDPDPRRMSEVPISIEQLVEDVQIAAINFYEVSAVRTDDPGDPEGEADVAPSYLLDTSTSEDGAGFRVRIRTEIDVAFGHIVVDLGAIYELNSLSALDISPETLIDFVNGISIMTLVPYNRQAIADITQRVFGASLTMPMIKRGELEFHISDAEEQ